jgi:hypothetical protein
MVLDAHMAAATWPLHLLLLAHEGVLQLPSTSLSGSDCLLLIYVGASADVAHLRMGV